MNFLLQPTQIAGAELSPVHETAAVTSNIPKPSLNLESLKADNPYPQYSIIEDRDGETNGAQGENGSAAGLGAKNSSIVTKHSDVLEEEGWIMRKEELPDNWNDAPDINSSRSLDRPFVFPGERAHILVCLFACKQDTEIITPFKVAAVMSKNGKGQNPKKENGNTENVYSSASSTRDMSPSSQERGQNSEKRSDVLAGESLLRMEDHKRQTEILLERFEKSHFFVRIAESDEPLWSRKTATKKSSVTSDETILHQL